MLKSKESYSEARFDHIQHQLDMLAGSNTPAEYAVLLDGVPVVTRTADPSLFKEARKRITPDTRCIRVYFFPVVGSPENEEYIFRQFLPEVKGEPVVSSDKIHQMPQADTPKVCPRHRRIALLREKCERRDRRIEKLESRLDTVNRENELMEKIITLYERQDKVLQTIGDAIEQLPALLSQIG